MDISTENTKESIRAANDIVDVIGSYITVKRAGSAFKALCPFHQEKTPSFVINQHRQSYHCFGCNAGGDVFRFVMEREGVDFPTSMQMLADRAGIKIQMRHENSQKRSDKDALYKIHEQLASFYARILKEHNDGAEALKYLKNRDITEEMINVFNLGYAPDRNTLINWAEKNDFTRTQLINAGVIVQNKDGSYDRFRGRIMFPICDALGRIIGFSGRILHKERSPAKYMNSPETLIFKKSRVLYGLHRARKPIIDARRALVCEGQLDCIRCQMSGFENSVAPQGTALTAEQARIIKRSADAVTLMFDPDEAGRKAAVRSAEIMFAEGLSVNVAVLPNGSDPNTLIRENGIEALQSVLNQAQSAVLFQIDFLSANTDMNDNASVMRVARAALRMTAQCDSAIQRDQLLRQIAKRLNLSESALIQELNGFSKTTIHDVAPPRQKPKIIYPSDELAALRYLCNYPQVLEAACEFLSVSSFTSPTCQQLFSHITKKGILIKDGLSRTLDSSDSDTIKLAAQLDAEPVIQIDSEYSPEDAFKDIIMRLRYNAMKRERETLQQLDNPTSKDKECQRDLIHWMSSLRIFMHSRDWRKAALLLKLHSST